MGFIKGTYYSKRHGVFPSSFRSKWKNFKKITKTKNRSKENMNQILSEVRIPKNEKYVYRVTIENFGGCQYVNFRECAVGENGSVCSTVKGLTFNTKFLPEVMAALKKSHEFLTPVQQGTGQGEGGQNNSL